MVLLTMKDREVAWPSSPMSEGKKARDEKESSPSHNEETERLESS